MIIERRLIPKMKNNRCENNGREKHFFVNAHETNMNFVCFFSRKPETRRERRRRREGVEISSATVCLNETRSAFILFSLSSCSSSSSATGGNRRQWLRRQSAAAAFTAAVGVKNAGGVTAAPSSVAGQGEKTPLGDDDYETGRR